MTKFMKLNSISSHLRKLMIMWHMIMFVKNKKNFRLLLYNLCDAGKETCFQAENLIK